uniref:Uncharacterized protein LOC113796856 n=1 Tax=Dermatophagoides pteronyssinus TaxID=6956 RepID=A0A6P6YCD4_DERPT|nr:uncharacterized protein LOC113796856 [Dermatophagoides pteronyssinus]
MKFLYVFSLVVALLCFLPVSWSVKPDEFAQDCIDSLTGANLIQWCRTGALIDYDPIRLHTNVTTVWETCCQAFDELECYQQQGQRFCPYNIFLHLKQYIQESRQFFAKSFCKNPGYNQWQEYCQNLTYQALHHNDDHHHKLELFLPDPNNDQTRQCLNVIQNLTDDGDRIEFCRQQTFKELPKKFDESINSKIFCCAQYNFMECIAKQAQNYCHSTQRSNLLDWSRQIFGWASDKICHSLPYYENGDENHLDSQTSATCRRYGYDLRDNFIGKDSAHNSSSKWWLFIPITLVIGVIIGAIYYYKYR